MILQLIQYHVEVKDSFSFHMGWLLVLFGTSGALEYNIIQHNKQSLVVGLPIPKDFFFKCC